MRYNPYRFYEPMEDELYHYGILGMKWGVRKERMRANRELRKSIRKQALNNFKRSWERVPTGTKARMGVAAGMIGASLLARGVTKGIAKGHIIKDAVQIGRAGSMLKNGNLSRAEHFTDSATDTLNKASKAATVYKKVRRATKPSILVPAAVLGSDIYLEAKRQNNRQKYKQNKNRRS